MEISSFFPDYITTFSGKQPFSAMQGKKAGKNLEMPSLQNRERLL
jgi:hypothetical protein